MPSGLLCTLEKRNEKTTLFPASITLLTSALGNETIDENKIAAVYKRMIRQRRSKKKKVLRQQQRGAMKRCRLAESKSSSIFPAGWLWGIIRHQYYCDSLREKLFAVDSISLYILRQLGISLFHIYALCGHF